MSQTSFSAFVSLSENPRIRLKHVELDAWKLVDASVSLSENPRIRLKRKKSYLHYYLFLSLIE